MISLQELLLEFRKAINLDKEQLKDHVIKKGYNFAKDYDSVSSDKAGYIEKREFRMFLKFIYLRIIFEKLFSILDESGDKLISRDEFAKTSFVLEKLGLTGLKFEDIDIDGSGEITLEEMMRVVIKNIEVLEIESGDLTSDEDDLPVDKNPNLENIASNELKPDNNPTEIDKVDLNSD